MFKKQFSVQAQNLLSKKDLKSLKSQILEQFAGFDDKVLDKLLPEGQVKILKLDNRCALYACGEQPPCFFDVDGRGDVYPCLSTAWEFPDMMPELTIHAPVSKHLLRGADLMLPGVIVPANGVAGLGSVAKGQKRCVRIDGNPYAIAVGRMAVGQAELETLKGSGLEIVHVFKDKLWAHGGKVAPNAGFTEKEDEVAPCADASYVPGEGGTAAPAPSDGAAEGDGAAADPAAAPQADSAAPPADAPPAAAASSARAAADWSQDDLLEFCFMQAFKVSLEGEKALPVEASELYEKHMKPQRPEGTTLDVKKSSHKQIGKFLNVMRKAKVIDVVEKKGVISVTKVDLQHKSFAQMQDKYAGEVAASAASAPGAQGAAAATSNLAAPKILTVWKPTHYTEPLFKAMGKNKSGLYSWEDASKVLRSYCEKEQLLEGDDVKLSEEILTMLYRAAGAQKKDLSFPEKAEFSEVEVKLQERMQEHTTIDVAGVGPTTRKGPPVKIEVSLSRKGAHNITRICNLEAYGIDVQGMGDELKKRLNCTVHIEDMPGKNTKDKLLQLQGHVQDEVAAHILSRYGIARSFMSVK